MAINLLLLQQGLMNLTSVDGPKSSTTVAHCNVSGEIQLLWSDGTTTNYVMEAGEDAGTYDAKTVTVISGTFTLCRG